jgi:WD40 repeat protein
LGIPKITDFGLARDRTTARELTQQGQAMGTPCYMAPEQARGEVALLGPAVDIYGLGAILYELLSGRPPFEEPSAARTIARVQSAEPAPPPRASSKLPRDLVTVCLKCLEKDPRRRYASALDLADDLRRFLAGEPIRARPVGPVGRCWRWCRRRPLVASLLAVSAALAVTLVVQVLISNAKLQRALDTSRKTLVLLSVTVGMDELEKGNSFTGLLWLTEGLRTEGLRLDAGSEDRERNHRIRIATTLRQCPSLEGLVAAGDLVLCARLGPGGCWAVTAAGRTVQEWDVGTWAKVGPDLDHEAAVVRAALSLDGRVLATADTHGKARAWDVRTGRPLTPPLAQGAAVDRVMLDAAGRVLITQQGDARLQVWDVTTARRILPRQPPTGAWSHAACSADGRWVFVLAADRNGYVWEAATGKAVAGPLKLDHDVRRAAFSADGSRLALAGSDHQVRILEVVDGRMLGRSVWHAPDVTALSFSPDGQALVTASADHTARVWHVAGGEPQTSRLHHEGTVTHVEFSPDGRRLVTCATDNRARLWDAATGKPLTPPLRHNGSVVYAAFGAGGRRLVTAGQDNVVRLWEMPRPAGDLAGGRHDPEPAGATLNSGRRLVKEADGCGVRVRDARTGKPLGPPLRHGSAITHFAFSPDGRRVLTTSDDNTARVWDVATGRALLPPLFHGGTVLSAAFRRDGRQIVTVTEDDTVRVWDGLTGEPLTAPLPPPCRVLRVAFSRDGSRVIALCAGGKRHDWDLTPERRPVDVLVSLAKSLAGSRIDAEKGRVPLDADGLRSAWQTYRARR